MIQYRITKYNPASRDTRGAFLSDEWTSLRDIGRAFTGGILTEDEYRRVEQAYISSAIAFLKEGGLSSLTVEGLENNNGVALGFREGSILTLQQVGDPIGQMLREEFWCRLEDKGGFVHIGWTTTCTSVCLIVVLQLNDSLKNSVCTLRNSLHRIGKIHKTGTSRLRQNISYPKLQASLDGGFDGLLMSSPLGRVRVSARWSR